MTQPGQWHRLGRLQFHCAQAPVIILAWILALMLFCTGAVAADAQAANTADIRLNKRPTVTIGVLAYQSLEKTLNRWQPTADYLSQKLPGYRFTIQPLFQPELNSAINGSAVDFILTSPDDYISQRSRHDIHAIATLTPYAKGRPVSQFGGVIFTRADRSDINALRDLRGKSLIAERMDSLGSYIAQQWVLDQIGIDSRTELGHQRFIGPPMDNTVAAVINGNADIGFVRTGVLENMIHEGSISPSQFKIINAQPTELFPFRLSTELYPEWPLAALPHVDGYLSQAVSLKLQWIDQDDPAAVAGQYGGFSPPLDYTPVEALMLKLNVHPNSERLAYEQLYQQLFRWGALVLTILLLVGLLVLLRIRRLNRKLQGSNRQLKQHEVMLEHLAEGVFCIDAQGHTQFINPAALKMLGYDSDEVNNQHSHRLFHHSHPDGSEYPIEQSPVHRTLVDGFSRHCTDSFIRKDGLHMPVDLSTNAIYKEGSIDQVVVVFDDISERQLLQGKIDHQWQLIQSVINSTPDLIAFKNTDSIYLGCNSAFEQFCDRPQQEIIGYSDFELFAPDTARLFKTFDKDTLERETAAKNEEWVTYPDGSKVLLETLRTPFYDAEKSIIGLVAVSRDITARKQAEQQVAQLAFYDPLTQLPNRRLLSDRVDRAIAECKRHQKMGAVMMIDLDHFKAINDNEGHDAGDQVLCTVANQLLESVRETDTVARLGGDEFLIVLEDMGSDLQQAEFNAAQIATAILDRLQQPHLFNGNSYTTTPSIGIALFLTEGDSDSLLKRADQAMYHAKNSGRNSYHFSPFTPVPSTDTSED